MMDYQEIIRSYIISQIPGSPDVRDVLQEVNILLWEKMDKFELGTKLGAWACTIGYYKGREYRNPQARSELIHETN